MTVKVLEFKRPDEPHCAGEAICSHCKHEWVAAAPVGCRNLECPSCGTHQGIFKWPFSPAEGDESYQCNCGSDDFFIMRRPGWANGAVFCRGCSTRRSAGLSEVCRR